MLRKQLYRLYKLLESLGVMLFVMLLMMILLPIFEGKYEAGRNVSIPGKLLLLLKLPALILVFILVLRARIFPAQYETTSIHSWQISTVLTVYDVALFICLYMMEVISMLFYQLRHSRLQY